MATGTVDFDDISIEPVTLPNALPRALPIRADAPESTFEGGPTLPGWKLDKGAEVIAEGGNGFLRLQNKRADASVGSEARFRLPAGWTSVRLSARVRANELQPGPNPLDLARLEWHFEDANRAHIGTALPAISLDSDSEWTTLKALAVVPPNAVVLRIAPKLANATGTFDIDDISIEAVED